MRIYIVGRETAAQFFHPLDVNLTVQVAEVWPQIATVDLDGVHGDTGLFGQRLRWIGPFRLIDPDVFMQQEAVLAEPLTDIQHRLRTELLQKANY
jgi:hypothetical protein